MNYPATLMRSLLLALALLVVAPLTGMEGGLFGASAAQAQTVSRISVEGNTRVDDATVVSYLAVREGQRATSANINASIESLYASGLFRTVNVSVSGSTLVVTVSELPIIASVLFEGNQRFSDAQLLTMVSASTRGTYSEQRVSTDVESIRLAYEQQGFTGVTVTARTEEVENARVRLVFVVNEGARAGIAAINFTGNNTFGAGVLKGEIRTKESHWLSFLFRDDTYDEAQLNVDKELIRLYYANHGFPDAQVTSAVAEYDSARNAYFINFTIVEGDRYSFGNIGVETSIAGLNTDPLLWSVRTRQGSGYDYADLMRTTEDLAWGATQQGFPFADVRPRIDRDVANRTFNVTYLIDEGARIYVERINITGNEKTRDFVIRRELEFAEGDPFNRAIVSRGKTAIEALGFFSTVSVTTEPGSAPDKVVINVAVVEQSTGDYGVTLGYSTNDGILGEVSLTERNFLGRGQYLRIAVGATGAGQTYDFSFTEPRFAGLKISAGVDLYARINEETASSYYGSQTTGGQLRFGIPITNNLTGTVFTGLENKVLVDIDATNSVVVAGTGETLNKAWIGYTLTFSTLDNVARPRDGLYATLTQQYIGWDHNLLRTEARARYFMTLVEEWAVVGSVRGVAGIVNDFSGTGVHGTEAFYLGANVVRGFNPRGYGPRSGGEAVGATAYAGISAEVEFPIPVLPETYGLRGAVWADAAVLYGNGTTAPIDAGSVSVPLRATAGASIIWDSPFGPLRGDFILPPISQSPDDDYVPFQLTLSTLL